MTRLRATVRSAVLLTLLLAAGTAAAAPPEPMREELEAAMRLYYADSPDAYEALKSLAERGCVKAQIKLSSLYSTGDDGQFLSDPERKARRFQWLRRAADNGNAQAQAIMGMHLAFDRGEDGRFMRRFDEARQWFLRAAEQGYPAAMSELGVLYYYGRGVEHDLVQTYKWWALAAPRYPPPTDEPAYGVGSDNEAREHMLWRLKEGLEPHMSRGQVEEAKRLVREWEEAHKYIRHMPQTSERPLPIWLNAIEGGCDD